ncbi:MAG TPA: glycosyltransferase [Actinomycetota bacterium]|nr:glycosyltransferase [Actinomycetota bacterium]
MSDVPDEVRRLVAERERRRAARDFAAADALRDRIAELGFRVVDSLRGSRLEPLPAPGAGPPPRLRAADVASALREPATVDVSIQWVCQGWPEDVERALDGFRRHSRGRPVQYVVADTTGELGEGAFGDDVEVLPLEAGTGWAAARNAGLRRSRGRVILATDPSVEPAGDVLAMLVEALADPTVGVCGPFGVVTSDLREFEPSAGPDVDAIEGYLMAFRREVLEVAGFFDERFRWYRTADIEYSFRVKDAGLRAVVVDVPVVRHEHRMWLHTPPDERAAWSKRNYYRFLDRFRGRFDLLVSRGGSAGRREEPSA